MCNIKCHLSFFLLFGLITTLQAQNTIPATGGNAIGTGGTVSYTVGQVAYSTYTGNGATVIQGVQQPYEISVVTALYDIKKINLICKVYPNPVSTSLTLVIEDYEYNKYSYWLYGANGNLIETKEILSTESRINLDNQTSGTYFLKITSGKKELKTFKIIKK